jgi:hypothetical protein
MVLRRVVMIAGVYKIVCDQGATFERVITVKDSTGSPMNLTGYTARMQVRREIESSTILVELTTENGRIALGGAAGTITLSMNAATTAAIEDEGVYDLEIISNAGAVHRVLKGRFVLQLEVTR